MADVFISYKREDKAIAERLANALGALNYTVWWDRDLIGGDDFRGTIRKELDLARAVLVIWSETSTQSQWVLDEAERGLNAEKLIPVRLSDRVELPLGFGGVHTETLGDWAGDPTAPVIGNIDQKISDIKNERFRSALLSFGRSAVERKVSANDALRLFRELNTSIGGVPIGAFAVGAFLAAAAAAGLQALGAILGANNLLVALFSMFVWWLVFIVARTAHQFVQLAKGRSARRFFDESFSFWIQFTLLLALLYICADAALIAVRADASAHQWKIGEVLWQAPVIAMSFFGIVTLTRVAATMASFLQRQL